MNKEQVYEWLGEVTDPEVPVLTILDLGIVRDVVVSGSEDQPVVTVVITPTYSGCPAMDAIALGIRMALAGRVGGAVNIEMRLSPAWTTDWMTEEGRQKLKDYGIAPPVRKSNEAKDLFEEDMVECPRCGWVHTTLVSRFGPTSCKALYTCDNCKEPFEHFKCH